MLLDAGYNEYFTYSKNRTKLIQLNKPIKEKLIPVLNKDNKDLINVYEE